jgi:hypothetical protein
MNNMEHFSRVSMDPSSWESMERDAGLAIDYWANRARREGWVAMPNEEAAERLETMAAWLMRSSRPADDVAFTAFIAALVTEPELREAFRTLVATEHLERGAGTRPATEAGAPIPPLADVLRRIADTRLATPMASDTVEARHVVVRFPEGVAAALHRVARKAGADASQITGALKHLLGMSGDQVGHLLASGQARSSPLQEAFASAAGRRHGAAAQPRLESCALDPDEQIDIRIIAVPDGQRWRVHVRVFEAESDQPLRRPWAVEARLRDQVQPGSFERFDPDTWTLSERLTEPDLADLTIAVAPSIG